MSNYIDLKYLNLLSSQLLKFKRKNDNLWNFRCPFCGDSQKDANKARGYVFPKEGDFIFKCHNCGHGTSLGNLIKEVDFTMYQEYVTERFVNKGKRTTPKKPNIKRVRKKKYLKDTPLTRLKKMSQLKPDHPARQYLDKRKIPSSVHYKLFYAPKFFEWVNTIIPNKFPSVHRDEPRLVIPFIDEYENLIGLQGRAFGKSLPKYITIMLDEDAPKIYGLDTIDWKKPVYIVEGPIDSLFLDNAIAMAGADTARFEKENIVYCYDNEPRSKEIVRRMEKAIDDGSSIVIFPNSIKEKDINDMVLAGRDPVEIQRVISNNTFNGLSAKAKLSEWRKV